MIMLYSILEITSAQQNSTYNKSYSGMSIRSVSRNKRTSRSFLNQPIEYREVMRKRNSHEMVGALEYAPITPNSRFA